MSEISILTVDGVSFNLSDDKVRGSLSEVEMTPRASKTYAVGDYLIYQGRFYKVVQVIDQDSFFEIGTNIIPVTVGEELELKASLESPTFSGSPKVPTADVGTRTTQIASTAYVQSELDSVKERIQSVQNGLDGIDSNIGDRVTAVAASTTTAWMNAHITNTDSVLLDSSLTVEGAAADAKAVGDAIDELPKIVNTDEVGADFDLADSDGNVLVRFEDGHIKVKNFDSSTLSDSFNEKIDIQQDSSDVGKALVVGEDGKVSPADISIDVDTTLSIEGAVADAKAVGDALDALSDEIVDSIDTLSDELDSSINELDSSIDSRISSLNEDITNLVKTPEESDADLYVADRQGHVLAEFKDGHIVTKNFDSSTLPATLSALSTAISEKIATQQSASDAGKALVIGLDGAVAPAEIAPEIEIDATLSQAGEAADAKAVGDALQNIPTSDIVKETVEEDADLYISDNRGNVLCQFRQGGIETQKFNSDDVLPPIETFSLMKTYVRGTTNTFTINATFKKGDEIYFHLADDNRYDAYGRYASYYEGSKLIDDNRRGSNGYVRHVISTDCASVGITIGGTEYTDGTELTLYVYRKNGEVQPKVVTVKADGTGMFTTLKAAVDSITDANHLTNPYVIEVYPGTYDTLEGFTEEEIQSADEGGGYGQDTIVGVKLTDGISLIGVGRADDIILTAELDTTNYNSGVRGNISTLNTEGEMSLENVTIIGKNLRYCVHDDFTSPINSHDKRVLRNCKFKGSNLAYSPLMTTYGAGMSAPRDYLIENCDFGYDLGIHSNANYTFGCTIIVNNCSGTRFRLGDSANAEANAKNRVIINNCNFQVIKITHGTSGLSNHMPIEGTGNEQSMIKDSTGDLYHLGMIDLIPKGIATGKMVKRVGGNLTCEVTTDKAAACGVVIGSDTDFAYVQKCGYIASNYLGLTGLAIGDYLTVDNSGSVVTGGTASNAVAVVKAVDSDGVAYAQLLI